MPIISRAGDIAAWPTETSDKSSLDRVSARGEYDRYGTGCRLGCKWRRLAPGRGNHCNLKLDQFSSQRWKPIVMTFRPAILDCDVLAFEITRLPQPLQECLKDRCRFAW